MPAGKWPAIRDCIDELCAGSNAAVESVQSSCQGTRPVVFGRLPAGAKTMESPDLRSRRVNARLRRQAPPNLNPNAIFCPVCEYECANNAELTDHMQAAHNRVLKIKIRIGRLEFSYTNTPAKRIGCQRVYKRGFAW